MSADEQLKELLEKLDFVTSMRCSGARTRRMRLLRREINSIRYRQGQPPRHSLLNGHFKEEEEDDDEEDGDEKEAKTENGRLSSDKGEKDARLRQNDVSEARAFDATETRL